jgi:hypothetical protein
MKIKIEKYRSAFYNDKSIKLKDVDFNNYAKVIQSDSEGYQLQSADGKITHSKWRNNGNKTMSKIEVQSPYVKAGVNVKQGDVLIIRSEGELKPSQDGKTKSWYFDLELSDGEVKSGKINKTSIENLTSGFGTDESSEWLGKEIVADEIIKYQRGNGVNYKVKK